MPQIDKLLVALMEAGGSDLHLVAGLEPRMRKHGGLQIIEGWGPLADDAVRQLLEPIASPGQWREFCETNDLDFAYGLEGVARFRANYFVQEYGASAVFRIIPEEILPLAKLKLPPAIEKLAHLDRGLVLVTGPTGSGKSTTLAAIINEINETYSRHIVTIEDPVEFVHQNKKSILSHREVGEHTESFSDALRSAVRQDADVIVVGEMRAVDTISLAITAAEMGTLVFGTLHTNNAPKTIDRLIDTFPAEEQAQARTTLSESLAAIVAQLLLKTADGKGRCASNKILLKTPGLPNIIREGKTTMLYSLMQSGKAMGMQSMDESLMGLFKEGRISIREAYMKATLKATFEPMLKAEGVAPAE